MAIKLVTQEEFEKLFSEVQKQLKKTKSKDKQLRLKQYMMSMLLGFEAGMRISEILGHKGISKRKNQKTGEIVTKPIKIPLLQKENIENNLIRIFNGKGRKDRVVPKPKRINQKAIEMLPLIIKRRSLQDFFVKLSKRVLNKDLSFHALRHGFGSHLANMGRPLHEIQMLMGHSRLDTTGIYLHANPTKAIKEAIDVF